MRLSHCLQETECQRVLDGSRLTQQPVDSGNRNQLRLRCQGAGGRWCSGLRPTPSGRATQAAPHVSVSGTASTTTKAARPKTCAQRKLNNKHVREGNPRAGNLRAAPLVQRRRSEAPRGRLRP